MPFSRLTGLRRSWTAVGTALLITCFLATQFIATTHELAVRHATCPQHGELMDVDGQDTGAGATVSAATPTQVSASKVADSQTHHPHCLFVSSRGNHKGFRVAGPVVESAAAVAQLARSGYSEAPRLSLAIYLTAPKHSPPSA